MAEEIVTLFFEEKNRSNSGEKTFSDGILGPSLEMLFSTNLLLFFLIPFNAWTGRWLALGQGSVLKGYWQKKLLFHVDFPGRMAMGMILSASNQQSCRIG